MKKWILAMALAQNLAFAGVPACLTDKGLDKNDNRIIQGAYTITVDISSYSKEDLVAFVKLVNGTIDIYPKNFPRIYGDRLTFDANPSGVASDEAFTHIVNRVDRALETISEQPGVTVRCEVFMHPNPSGSGGT
jgi:hypothetical protein